MKICKQCGLLKPHYTTATTRDGLRNPCRTCQWVNEKPKYHLKGLMKIGKPYKQMIKEPA